MMFKSNKVRRYFVAAVTVALFTGLFAGCSGGSDRVLLPTPTPRTENNKGDGEVTKAPVATDMPEGTESNEAALLKPAGSYEAVYEALQKVQESGNYRDGLIYKDGLFWVTEDMEMAEPEEFEPTVDSSENGMGGDSAGGNLKGEISFSETNMQVEGIDEADIIKTDGQYFYVLI